MERGEREREHQHIDAIRATTMIKEQKGVKGTPSTRTLSSCYVSHLSYSVSLSVSPCFLLFLPLCDAIGKSFLLRRLINMLRARWGTGLAQTAPTGIAASQIMGCTVYSWAGIGRGDKTARELAQVRWRGDRGRR